MGKKKGAIAAKARAKREAKARDDSPEARPADDAPTSIVAADGCRVQRGLKNLGNTCYMNSMLQCLNVSFPFSDEMLGGKPPVSGGMSGSLSTVFGGIRAVDDTPASNAFDPKPLQQQLVSRFPWFRGKEQQDAHEFLRTLLGSVSDEFEQAGSRAKASSSDAEGGKPGVEDRVIKYFSGRWCAATLCWGCRRMTLRLDPFLDVPLHLPALAGQLVGAMGVTPAMASGEDDPAPAGFAAEASGEDNDEAEGSSSKRSKERKGRGRTAKGKAAAPAPAAAQPKAAKPRGVWGAAIDKEELRQQTRAYLGGLILRVLQREEAGEAEAGEAEAEAAEEAHTFEITLQRQSKEAHPQWGFKWSETKCNEGDFVLCGVVEDSVLERWNLKRRALGDEESIICVGDRLVEVNGEAEYKEMSKTLRAADVVTLTFARAAGAAGADLGRGRDESDGEEERKAQAAAAKEALRREFCSSATSCHEALPEVLRDTFGPQKPLKGPNDKVLLEHCLHHFSAVEAIEDDFKPVYNCTRCAKEKVGKTFASRRMWLMPGSLPPLLTLQLKRFRRYRDRFEKSVASIGLPLSLDLSDYVLSDEQLQSFKPYVDRGYEDLQGNGAVSLKYELYGMCVHQGSSMKSGHYIAYVNSGASLEEEKWFEISDAKRRSCTRAEVLKAEAYVAFYRREGVAASAASAAVLAAARARGAREAEADADIEEGEGKEDEEDGAASIAGSEAGGD